jgi:flagellar biosynthesis GTPase FlhF
MQTKTYLAPTKLEALLKIREEHGADAVILSERTVQKGKLFGRKPMVEIVVGIKSAESELKLNAPDAESRAQGYRRIRSHPDAPAQTGARNARDSRVGADDARLHRQRRRACAYHRGRDRTARDCGDSR